MPDPLDTRVATIAITAVVGSLFSKTVYIFLTQAQLDAIAAGSLEVWAKATLENKIAEYVRAHTPVSHPRGATGPTEPIVHHSIMEI